MQRRLGYIALAVIVIGVNALLFGPFVDDESCRDCDVQRYSFAQGPWFVLEWPTSRPDADRCDHDWDLYARERSASPSIKTLVTAQADFRANDRDRNGIRDFWVADIGGLYRMHVDDPNPCMMLIEPSLAYADAQPALAFTSKGPLPLQGSPVAYELMSGSRRPVRRYWYVALATYEEAPGRWLPYDNGTGRNRSRFGLCRYPAKYGEKSKLTFIVNEDNILWKKDTGGVPPRGFPLDPAKDGWTRMD